MHANSIITHLYILRDDKAHKIWQKYSEIKGTRMCFVIPQRYETR